MVDPLARPEWSTEDYWHHKALQWRSLALYLLRSYVLPRAGYVPKWLAEKIAALEGDRTG